MAMVWRRWYRRRQWWWWGRLVVTVARATAAIVLVAMPNLCRCQNMTELSPLALVSRPARPRSTCRASKHQMEQRHSEAVCNLRVLLTDTLQPGHPRHAPSHRNFEGCLDGAGSQGLPQRAWWSAQLWGAGYLYPPIRHSHYRPRYHQTQEKNRKSRQHSHPTRPYSDSS